MTPHEQITAWKDATFRDALDPATRDAAAPDPAADPEVPSAAHGAGFFDGFLAPLLMMNRTEYVLTLGCCQGITSNPVACPSTVGPCASVVCINPATL